YFAYAGQAWNIMMGFAGQLSLGHAIYVGLGAYTSAALYVHFGVAPWLGMLVAIPVAMACGAIIGFLAFRFGVAGVYFAILTIAFAEFARIGFDHIGYTGGSAGFFLPVAQYTQNDLWNLRGQPVMFYYVILVLALAALLFSRLLLRSRLGYFWLAIREDDEAARAVGNRYGIAARTRLRLAQREAGVLWHLPADRRDGAAGRNLAVACAPPPPGAQVMSAHLTIAGVSKRFRGLVAVDRVSCDVMAGEIFAVIGPNGAGKTTLSSTIAGALKPDEGEIRLDGARIDGLRPDEVCRRGLARTFQIVRPFPALTVEDNVMVGALLRTADTAQAAAATQDVMRRLDLFDKRARVAKSLTLPDRKRLEVARALATSPRLLLLDEVMAGLRPTETDRMVAILRDLSAAGLTILLIEHVMRAVM